MGAVSGTSRGSSVTSRNALFVLYHARERGEVDQAAVLEKLERDQGTARQAAQTADSPATGAVQGDVDALAGAVYLSSK